MLAAHNLLMTPSGSSFTPVTFDASAGVAAAGTTTNPLTWSHTAAANSYVVVSIAAQGNPTITAATYGGNAMTLLAVSDYNDSTTGTTLMYGISDISGGTRTISITRSSNNWWSGISTSYTGVAQVLTRRAVSFPSASAFGWTVPCRSTNNMVVSAFGGAQIGSNFAGTSGGITRDSRSNSGQDALWVADANASTTFSTTSAVVGAALSVELSSTTVTGPYMKAITLANVSAAAMRHFPEHLTGDLLVVGAFAASATTISKPSAAGSVPAWNDIDANTGASSVAMRTEYFQATGNDAHTSGVWSNATQLAAMVITGHSASNPIGGHAESGSTATSGSTAPSATLTNTDGTSLLLEIFGRAPGNWTSWSSPPTGYSPMASNFDGSSRGICIDTKNDSTSDGSVTQATNGTTSVGYRGATVEIRQH